MRKNWTYIFVVIILVLNACSDEVSVNIPEQNSLLVLNSYFTVDSLWQAELSSTISTASKPEKRLVGDASLVLYQNNNPVDTLNEVSSGIYMADIKPLLGQTYTITARADGFPTVQASGGLPAMAIDFNIIGLEPAEDLPSFLADNYLLQLAIESNQEEPHFFNLSMYTLQEDNSAIRVDSAFLADQSLVGTQDEGRGITFSANELSDNGLLEVYVQKNYLVGKQLIVFLKTISPEYYQYEISLQEHLNTTGTPFSQPVPVYSNVMDGYGIFAGYMIATDTLGL